MNYVQPSIHDFITSRSDSSNPVDDLEALGYKPHVMYREIIENEQMTIGLFYEMAEPAIQRHLANYAMTWLTIGACLEHEKHGQAAADNLPPFTDK